LSRFVQGDCIAALQSWQGGAIRLLLTDPPYGVEYQSNRRWRTQAPDKVAGDGAGEAMVLLSAAIGAALPHLAESAHILIFCDWEREPEVRAILAGAGLTIKGSLIWAKEEHSAGDVRGSFGPSHERIIHAVKGSPEVTPRRRDVFNVARSRESDHPMEKPVELLRQLIECTTAEGDLVVDLFAGQASTLVAALRMGRDFWGAELSEAHHEKGATRLLKEHASHVGRQEQAA
jgi:site-specific DNA-methyltransferase (adenine-specific)